MAADETRPLLENGGPAPPPPSLPSPPPKQQEKAGGGAGLSPASRILVAGLLISFTLGLAQVSIIYVFRLMECDIYYERHPLSSSSSSSFFSSSSSSSAPSPGGDRCARPEINAGTAQQVSILGMTTSFSGVINLFVSGYLIKTLGTPLALMSQTVCLGLRALTQVVGITIGGRTGQLFFQVFQLVGALGGPRGYQLVLNTAVSEMVVPRDRTAIFGRLQGVTMLGTAGGLLIGGLLADRYGIRSPFELCLLLYVVCTAFAGLCLQKSASFQADAAAADSSSSSSSNNDNKKKDRGLRAFFAPLRIIRPYRYRLPSGRVVRSHGQIFLALGIFIGVLASGYAPILLQMEGSSLFGFSTAENGWLMAGNSFLRGVFLYAIFPRIIAAGREWYGGGGGGGAPGQPPPAGQDDAEDANTGFDLLFVQWSQVVDAIVTMIAGFSSQGWHIFLAGYLLPFASGSAPAAKGCMTEMTPPDRRQDAIAGITLVESTAFLVTQGLFGTIFAAFSEVGQPNLTFFCNAACAALGFTLLFFARLPPADGKRINEDEEGDEGGEASPRDVDEGEEASARDVGEGEDEGVQRAE